MCTCRVTLLPLQVPVVLNGDVSDRAAAALVYKDYRWHVTCYVLRVTCYELRVTSYVLRVACYVLRVTCYVSW